MEDDVSGKRKQRTPDESHKKLQSDNSADEKDNQVLLVDNSPIALCVICQVNFDNSKLEYLPCCHVFHPMCISKWLHRNSICPVCRTPISNGRTLDATLPVEGTDGILTVEQRIASEAIGQGFAQIRSTEVGRNGQLSRWQAESRRRNEKIRRIQKQLRSAEEKLRNDKKLSTMTKKLEEVKRIQEELKSAFEKVKQFERRYQRHKNSVS